MWVTSEQIESARQIDLLTYLENYEPDNLKKIGTETYCTKEHDSLKISNGMWHWFSRHIGGKNALDYLMKVKGYSFTDAVLLLNNSATVLQKFKSKPETAKELEIPELCSDIKRVRKYLSGRGIDSKVIEYCNRNGMLFEDAAYHNCVFIGKDENGIPKYGALRSTTSDFKRDLDGSDKRYSFRLEINRKAESVHLFESVIDLLSYVTIETKKDTAWYKNDYLSLGGVYATDKKQDIPLALNAYIERNPDLKTVYLHFDNDEIGRKASMQITEAIKDRYEVIDEPPESGKDYNDHLLNEIRKRKEQER